MLVDRVLADLDVPDPDERQGNPLRGSRLGRCARQSAYMMFPNAYPPEPLPARTKLVFRFGDMIHELVREQFRRVVPGECGMEEERFHFKVPLTTKEAKAALAKFRAGTLTGSIQDGVLLRDFTSRGWSRVGARADRPHRRGLWLDLAEPALYVPLHVDGIADTGNGLASCEIKSMTTAGFRHALAGEVDYAYRVQMAAAVDATGLDAALYIAIRKDTSHALEVLYSRAVDKVNIVFTKQSQMVRATEQSLDGTPMDDWEAARVDHPFEPQLLEEARARVKRILLATPTNLPPREHLPSFICETCQGTGQQSNAKSTGLPLKNGPKPCPDCDKLPVPVGDQEIGAVGAPSGQVSEAELQWQCRYCPMIYHCWADAKPRLAFDKDAKPHFWVTRKDYEGMPT